VAQRETAAISVLFSVPVSAAEGDCGVQADFFSKLFKRGGRAWSGATDFAIIHP